MMSATLKARKGTMSESMACSGMIAAGTSRLTRYDLTGLCFANPITPARRNYKGS